jgi:hypothetical protein
MSSRNASSGDGAGGDNVEVGVVAAVEKAFAAAKNEGWCERLGSEFNRQLAETLCIAAERLPGIVAAVVRVP